MSSPKPSPSPPAAQDAAVASAGDRDLPDPGSDGPPPPASSRRPRRTHICPEPGSLYDIMHSYSGESLYALPICWTDLHPKALGVRFREQSPTRFPAPDPQPYPGMTTPPSPEPSPLAKQLCAELSTFVQPGPPAIDKIRALKHLFTAFFPNMPCKAKTSVDLDFHFGTKFYRKAVKLPLVWKHTTSRCYSFDSAATRPMSSNSHTSSPSEPDLDGASRFLQNAPLLAYVDRDHLASVRRSLFRISVGPKDGDFANRPVANLQRLRAKALVPSNPDCDAHFLAVLIAMAQARFYSKKTGRRKFTLSQQSSSDTPSSLEPDAVMTDVEVRLFTFDADAKDFIVYTAWIGADFLEGFAQPTQPLHRGPKGTSSMRMSYTRVPVWPFYGLKERLGRALGSEITGKEFSASGYDTFHTPEELPTYQAEVERIRVDEERRHREYTAYWREEQRKKLRKMMAERYDEDGKKRSRESSHGSSSDGSRSPSTPPSKRRRGMGATEVEVC
ncbi:hypothetical protein MAPG_05969 [Magnaporthiopsis poae ATCC 64411]|uniref:Uncharacterized protein n=1 Tax=Magnaporthiopsis poae (strain ATCC 64411 / 73-15) TaxID=644358 RepID=A0A0C4CSF7_MAGP6|nr:hypothetical protein, variant [Magnaporthiopsis poae ATCC 64411]KLU86963.1 hypothetical protein MAPG_05969 [Magnaporthiopsis poae ATCC 64411]